MIKLTINGQTPSKKNSKQRTGRFLISSKQYTKWHKEAIKQLKHDFIEPLKAIQLIEITLYGKDKRKRDLDNRLGSIMDVLVDSGYLEDDNYEVVPRIYIEYGGIDKENPRAEIMLHEKGIYKPKKK